MKIKRLTAALAVAAMAAGFTLASPMLSAQAATPQGVADTVQGTTTATIPGGQMSLIDPWATIASSNDPTVRNSVVSSATAPAGPGATTPVSGFISITGTGKPINHWSCYNRTAPTVTLAPGTTGGNLANLGSVKCDTATGQIAYTPNPAMGIMGDFQVIISYEIMAVPGSLADGWLTTYTNIPAIAGKILVTVTTPSNPSACDPKYTAQCLYADVQAYAKKAKTTSVKVELLTPNAVKASGAGFVTGNGIWGLAAINNADSNDKTLSWVALENALSFTIGANSSVVTFTPPAPNWSGTVTYEYDLASFANGVANNIYTGLLTFTVHPTLTAQDPIVSDQGAAVSVPVISQPPIGSGAFSHANCVFANSKSKTTLTDVGSISNKGSKDPVFTPTADFVGSIDLSCSVQDVWGTTSNTITVTIQVGVVAPVVPAAPTTAAPSCTTAGCSDGKLVSTGGSLAAPMSSGLAAVVLLVAAGAGILVVRRRTALAG